jgi:hypothetical protein
MAAAAVAEIARRDRITELAASLRRMRIAAMGIARENE